MVKPPIVFVVGAMRALGWGSRTRPPPTTSTQWASCRTSRRTCPGGRAVSHGSTRTRRSRGSRSSSTLLANMKITDVPGETAAAAYDRAYVAVGRPWLADGTESTLRSFAQTAPLVRCQSTNAAPARAAGADARRPRRPGDVMKKPQTTEMNALKCADCARSDSRVTDCDLPRRWRSRSRRSPGSRTGPPRTKSGLSRRSFLRGGVVGVASVYSVTHLSWDSIWNAAAAEAAGTVEQSDSYASTSTAATTASTRSCRSPPASTRVMPPSAPTSPGCSALQAAGDVGTTVMGGTGGTLAFANPAASPVSAITATRRASTRFTATDQAVPASDLADVPCRRLHAAQPVPF